jgi:CheY-like chemotaxis protein
MRDFDDNHYCFNPLYNQHIILLYEDKNKRNNIIVDYINEGLKNGCLCVYASVDIEENSKDFSLIDSISSRIINYEDNIQKGNLQFINFKPYFESVLKGDLTPFEGLKLELEYKLFQRISKGKKDKIIVFADAACNLSETKNFNECLHLEKWWQDVNLDWSRNNKNITVVCPHPNYVFKNDSERDVKNRLCDSFHDTTMDIENENSLQYFYNLITKNKQIRILIAESESDLCCVYKEYLNEYLKDIGFKVSLVGSGRECIKYLLDSKDKGEEEQFDIVILDSHLRDIKAIDVIKQIRKEIPNQRIVFTTTQSFSEIKNIIDSFGIDKRDILLKPFYFTKLLSVINPLITIK